MQNTIPSMVMLMVLLVDSVEGASFRPGDLTRVESLRIEVSVDEDTTKLGLTNERVMNKVIVVLKSRVPAIKLVYDRFSAPYSPFIRIAIWSSKVTVTVSRYAKIEGWPKGTHGSVWISDTKVLDKNKDNILAALDNVLTEFVSDWYRDNKDLGPESDVDKAKREQKEGLEFKRQSEQLLRWLEEATKNKEAK